MGHRWDKVDPATFQRKSFNEIRRVNGTGWFFRRIVAPGRNFLLR